MLATAILLMLFLALPGPAAADGISGTLEYNYGASQSKSSDASGSTSSKSTSLSERYSLELDKSFTTTIRMSAGANVQTSSGDSETNGLTSHSTSSRISPHIDLGYANGFFSGAAGFSRRIEDSKSNGVSSVTNYADSYSSRLSWMPEDFPNLNLIYSSFDSYDESRLSQDNNSTSLTVSTRYKPLQSLDLNYSGNSTTSTNRLSGFKTDSLTQSVRADYNDIFFKDRIAVSSSYTIATQKSLATNNGASTPSASSSLLPPVLVNSNIDTFFFTTTKSFDLSTDKPDFSGTNFRISNPLPGDSVVISSLTIPAIPDRTNLGMKFSLNQSVNIIRLLVSTSTFTPNHLFTATDNTAVASAFFGKIRVFTSSNGSSWTAVPNPPNITFNSFPSAIPPFLPTPAFELRLPSPVQANFIKIEIEPVGNILLSDGQLLKMSITSMELFLQDQNTIIPVGASRSSSQIGGAYNLNLRARLWDVPTVSFDSGFDLHHTKTDSSQFAYRYALSNGLSIYHVFSQTLSSSARLSRQDDINPAETSHASSNSLSVSLAATPLPTLSGTLNYSARQDKSSTTSKTSQSLNMSNSADLYRGVSLGLNVGGSLSSDNSGKEQRSMISSLGVNLLPHRSMSINIGVSDQESWAAGGDTKADSKSSYNRSLDATVTYNPVQAVYLFGTFNIIIQSQQKTQTAQSLGGSWSPFKDGALQLNVSYREGIQPDGTKDRTFSNSAHLTIRPGMSLDVSYLIASSVGVAQKSDNQSVSSSFRASF